MTDQPVKQSSAGLVSLPAIIEMADTYKLSPTAFAYTFRTVAMPQPHTDAEFVSCCLVAREHGLNPLTKEIYFMRDKTGSIQAIVGVDGWIKKCNEHPQFDGIEFADTLGPDGKATAIKARIFRKDRSRPVEVTEYMAECLQLRAKPGPWQSHPNRMLRHRSLIQCARIAFGFAGVMDRDEFDQWQAMKDVTPKPAAVATPAAPAIPMDNDGVPEMDEPEPQAAPADDTSDITDPEEDPPLSAVEEARALAELREALEDAKTPGIRMEVVDGYESLIDRMSPAGRKAAEKIIEGRS